MKGVREELRRIIDSCYEETVFRPEDVKRRGNKLMIFRPQLAINRLQKFIEGKK